MSRLVGGPFDGEERDAETNTIHVEYSVMPEGVCPIVTPNESTRHGTYEFADGEYRWKGWDQ